MTKELNRKKKENIATDIVSILSSNKEQLGFEPVLKGGILLKDYLYKSYLKDKLSEGFESRVTVDVDIDILLDNYMWNTRTIKEYSMGIDKILNTAEVDEGSLLSTTSTGKDRDNRLLYKVNDLGFNIDIGTEIHGDLVTEHTMSLQGVEGNTILAYRIETILADKISAISNVKIIGRRFKDFIDLYNIAVKYNLSELSLIEINKVTKKKGREFSEFAFEYEEDRIEVILDSFVEIETITASKLTEVLKTFLEPFKSKDERDLWWDRDLGQWTERNVNLRSNIF